MSASRFCLFLSCLLCLASAADGLGAIYRHARQPLGPPQTQVSRVEAPKGMPDAGGLGSRREGQDLALHKVAQGRR